MAARRKASARPRSRAERLAARTVPVAVLTASGRKAAPRGAPESPPPNPAVARAGRRAALAIAGAGLFWIAATSLGAALGWPQRFRALCDLFALAGFGFALYLTYRAWRIGRTKGN